MLLPRTPFPASGFEIRNPPNPSLQKGAREKSDLFLFHVIPAPYQVRGKLQPESSVFRFLRTDWTPVFTGVTAEN